MRTNTIYLLCLLFAVHGVSHAQMNIPNPLIKPVKAGRPVEASATESKPPSPPSTEERRDNNDPAKGETAQKAQEAFNLQQQQLNSERLPAPLRNLLNTMVLTVIAGELAVLRQQVAAPVANTGATLNAGNPSSTGGTGSTTPVSSQPTPTTSSTVGNNILNVQRPITIRLKQNQTNWIASYPLLAQINDQSVSLFWRSPQGEDILAFYANLESSNLANYVPNAALLERFDIRSYDRLAPSATGLTSSTTTIGPAGATGTGGGNNTGTGVR